MKEFIPRQILVIEELEPMIENDVKTTLFDGNPTRWWTVSDLQDYCIETRSCGLATSMVISGKWGSGKSQLSQLIAGKRLDSNYSLRRNVILNTDPMKVVRHIDDMGT